MEKNEKVEISLDRYEELVSAKARNDVLKNMVLRDQYIGREDIAIVLDVVIPEEEEEQCQ